MWKDKNNVYFDDRIIEVDSAEAFREIETNNYNILFRDDFNIYKVNIGEGCGASFVKSENVNFPSFEVIGYDYATDKNFVYFRGTKIPGADQKTFEVLRWPYAKDKNHVYVEGEILKNVDSQTFEILEGTYFKDKNGVGNRDDRYVN